MSKKPFRVGLIGFGNIGTGFVRHMMQHEALLAERAGRPLELTAVADKEFDRPRDVTPPPSVKMTTNWRELIQDPNIDAIVELVGVGADGKPSLAFSIASATLEAGKHFVTANKALIATHGAELHRIAAAKGALLLYEASVGAGIPIIASLQTSLAPDRINGIHGIVNGTTNFILTRMDEESSLTMEAAVSEAQRLGYAEPDPSADVNGDDAAYKITILASLAFGRRVEVAKVRKQGITSLSPTEFALARKKGWAVKLIASAARRGGAIEVAVRPVFLPAAHIMAGVRGVFNGVLIEGEPIGTTMYYGPGAGQGSTGSGLLADVIFAAKHGGAANPHPLFIGEQSAVLAAPQDIRGRHYFRCAASGAEAKERIHRAIPGDTIFEDDGTIAVVTPDISEADAELVLGKLKDSGVSSGQVCHVRFAFF